MESKRVMMLVTLMIVMAMGNLLIETEAQAQAHPPPPSRLQNFETCLLPCATPCIVNHKGVKCTVQCVEHCVATVLFPAPDLSAPSPPASQMILANEIDQTESYCTFGCISHSQCGLFTHLKGVVKCVDSCQNKCTKKN